MEFQGEPSNPQDLDNSFHVAAYCEPSVVQKSFSNSLIFRIILQSLSPSDLLSLRLVSTTFEKEATSYIRSNDEIQQALHVKFKLSNEQTASSCHEHVCMGTVSDFVKDCWNTSPRFPVLNFTFEDCHFGKRDILKFFVDCGKHIKFLSLNFCQPSSSLNASSLQKLAFILFDWTPNLRYLTLVSTPWPPDARLLAQNVRQKCGEMEYLESLTLLGEGSDCADGIIRDILLAAPGLERVFDPHLKFTKVLENTKRYLLGSQVKFTWKMERETVSRFLTFAKTKPKNIREISIDFSLVQQLQPIWPNVETALTHLFENCRHSLEKISSLPLLSYFPNVQLPVMEKVTTIRFVQLLSIHDVTRIATILPAGAGHSLQHIFPQLHTLELHKLQDDESTNQLFLQLGQIDLHHDGVTSLDLDPDRGHKIRPPWIRLTVTAFPNLTTLKVGIGKLKKLPEICRLIWTKIKGLEHLSFKLCYEDGEGSPESPGSPGDPLKFAEEMDTVFTGLPLKLCQRLRRSCSVDREVDLESVEQLRQSPSILDLDRLKTLKFVCHIQIWKFQPLFTSVSVHYAFQPMLKRQQFKATFQLMPNVTRVRNNGFWGITTEKKEYPIQ